MRRRSLALVLAFAAGCLGDPTLVPGTTGDTSTGGTGSSSASSTGSGSSESSSSTTGMMGEELLNNGSFEMWMSGTPLSWTDGDASYTRLEQDVRDGDAAVRVSTMEYQSMGQLVSRNVATGSCLDAAIWLRWDSGDQTSPLLVVVGADEEGIEYDPPLSVDIDWDADGDWHLIEDSLVVADDWDRFRVTFVSQTVVPQVISADGASLQLVPCG